MSSLPHDPRARPGLDELYSAEAPRILTWARMRIRPEHRGLIAPEDIAQDVWVRAVEKFRGYDPSRTNFRGWLLTVARFVLAEATRRAFLHQRVSGTLPPLGTQREDVPALVTSVVTRAARNEAMAQVFGYLDQLDTLDRQVFTLHCLEGLPQRQVAVALAIEENTVAKRWGRLRERLRVLAPAWLDVSGDGERIDAHSA